MAVRWENASSGRWTHSREAVLAFHVRMHMKHATVGFRASSANDVVATSEPHTYNHVAPAAATAATGVKVYRSHSSHGVKVYRSRS